MFRRPSGYLTRVFAALAAGALILTVLGPASAAPPAPTATRTTIPSGTSYWFFHLSVDFPLVIKRSGSSYQSAWVFDVIVCRKGTIKGRTTKFRWAETFEVNDPEWGTGTGLTWVEGGKLHIVDGDGEESSYDRLPATSRTRKAGAAALKDCDRLHQASWLAPWIGNE